MVRKAFVGLAFLAVATLAVSASAGEKKRFGADVGEWSSDTAAGPGVVPIGGSGQVNGNFVVAERNGVQIGIRASRRFAQNVNPLANEEEKKVGVYYVETGTSDALGRAIWNYDLHVDLRNAQGVAKGKTLGDYALRLDTDIGSSIFGLPVPLDFNAFVPGDTVLYQQSWNPKFGNAPFDATVAGVYAFTLTLTPATFRGPAITARMRVVVAP